MLSPQAWTLSASSVLLAFSLFAPAQSEKQRDIARGEEIYTARCMSCHGDQGSGAKEYPRPLAGSKSQDELIRYIQRSMPPEGKKLTADEAKAVGTYVYEGFYSAVARERMRPARIALSRLTVRQFQNSLSDLFSDSPPPSTPGTGLRGQYYREPSPEDRHRVIDRTDPQVAFDFGTGGPAQEGFDPYKFGAQWTGSILAPDTGEYDFIVRSNQSVVLFLNDFNEPLVDRKIVSGNDTDHRGVVTLQGGRTYSVRLLFTKSTLGVQEQDKSRQKPPGPSFVSLLWKRPKMAEEVVPTRFLYPDLSPIRFVPTTPFPPDDRSIGYERGTIVSREWNEATTSAAFEAASFAAQHINRLAGTGEGDSARLQKMKDWAERFAQRAFRRPLDPEEKARHIDRQFAAAPDPEEGLKRSVILTLKSPFFLYREIEAPGREQFATAANLSYGLWDTLPDQELLRAATAGELQTKAQIRAQAWRMAEDPRAWNKLRSFYLSWLKVEEVPDLSKDPALYPSFTPETASDLRTSLELFLERFGRAKDSTYSGLFLAQEFPINSRLAPIYGAQAPAGTGFSFAPLNPQERVGLLGHPYLLSKFSYFRTTSPIHRGVLLSRNIMGRSLMPPPEAVAPVAPDLHPSLTTRERVALQTRARECMSCHTLINPLGFSLERFDAIGRVRDKEGTKKVDSSGGYESRRGRVTSFRGPRDLAEYVAESEDAHRSFVERLFHHLVKQPVRAYGPNTLEDLLENFADSGGNIREALVEIMTATSGARPQNPKN